MVKNQASKMIKVGSAVREAREEGSDPVKAFVKAAPAYKLFEGEVENFTLQCDLCAGNPQCVKICTTKAIRVKKLAHCQTRDQITAYRT